MKKFKGFIETLLIISFLTLVLFAKNAYGVDRSTGTTTCPNPPSCITISELLQQIVARLDALEAGSGGSSPVLDYMKIVDGQLVIEGIDVRILNGNFLIGTGGTGTGTHNFILGHDNVWNGNYNMIVGTNNSTSNHYTFIHGYYNYVRGNGNYGGVFGGAGNLVETNYSIIAGGQNNQAINAGFVSILGGEGRYTTTVNEVIADGMGSSASYYYLED